MRRLLRSGTAACVGTVAAEDRGHAIVTGGAEQEGTLRADVDEVGALGLEDLDGATGEVIMDLLFDLRDRTGTTLLLITHDPALAARCGRIIRIADGRVAS